MIYNKVKELLNQHVRSKTFSITLVLCLFLPCYFSYFMVAGKVPTNKNQVVVWNQLSKIKDTDNNVRVAILGDSSAGNAIDATYFEALTGKRTINLALTGSLGLHGILLTAERAKRRFENIEAFYFIIAPTTWSKSLTPESYYLLSAGFSMKDSHLKELAEVKEAEGGYINWAFTPKRLYWYLKNSFKPDHKQGLWSEHLDYIVQGPKMPEDRAVKGWAVPFGKVQGDLSPLLTAWRKLCSEVECVFAHGPIFDGIANSAAADLNDVRMVSEELRTSMKVFQTDFVFVEYQLLGDTRNHILPEYKEISTRYYADIFINGKSPNTGISMPQQ